MPQLMTPNPWGITDGVSTTNQADAVIPTAPYTPPAIDSGEFAFVAHIQSSVSSAVANASRLFSSSNAVTVKQAEPLATGPAWYDIPGRIAVGASAVNDAFQSTLLKIIVLVAIVGVVAVFGLSFMQAKGANLAK